MARRKKPHPPVIADIPDEDYERYAGQWIAVKNGRAIFGSPDGAAVWDWLDDHGIEEATIVRLPGKNDPKTWTYGSVPAAHG